jgi:outer membrane autotransporter protein
MKTAVSHPYTTTPSRARGRSAKFRAGLLAASSAAALVLGIPAAHAQNATWTGAVNGSFTTAGNWNPAAVPTAIATFGTSNVTSITTGQNTLVGEFLFTGTSAFSFSQQTGGFEFTGAGIVNNSMVTQTYDNTVNSANLAFANSASAGNNNVVITNEAGIKFLNNSTGGNATFVNNAAASVIDFSGSTGLGGNNQLSAGSIAGMGTFSLGANQLTVGSDNTSTTVSGVIADGGANGGTGGSLVKTGTGTLTLTGTNTYTGGTTVTSGALVVTGSIATSSSTSVISSGILGGSGTVGTLSVNSGGTVAPGMGAAMGAFSTLTVMGNAAFGAGANFNVNINSAGQNDKLVVTGTANVNGTVNANALGGTGITTASTFTILTAGTVIGSFSSATSNLAFLTAHATTQGNSVVLSFTMAASPPPPPATPGNTPFVTTGANGGTITLAPGTFASVATTPNQIATANAVQALGKGPVFNAVIGQSVTGAQQAFTALSGEVHASTVNAAFTDATLPNTAILDRLNQPVSPPVLGAAIETTATYAADLPSRKGPVAPVAVQLYQPRLFDLWGQGFGDWGRVSSDGNAASLSRTTGGFVLGGDVSAANVLGGDWRFGLAGGYTNDSITVNQRGSSSTFESVFGGAYAGASFGAFQLRAGALYGTNTTSTTRQVVFPGFFEALSSNNGGYTAQGFGEAGYRVQLGGLGFGGGSRVSVEPFAGAAAFLIHQNGFTEVGGTSALTASARDFNVQTTTLGVRGELAFASMPLTLKTMLGWRHAYGDVVPSVLLTFQGGAQAFSSSGVPIDRDAFVAEAGIDYALTSMLSVGVSYSGQFGQRATDNAFKGNVNLRF